MQVMSQDTGDPFESIQSLEENYYQSGYELGVADGTRAGRTEGRIFGLEKGFEKFVELGKLAGKVNIWVDMIPQEGIHPSARRPSRPPPEPYTNTDEDKVTASFTKDKQLEMNDERKISTTLSLPNNPRLKKHIENAWALVEPATYSSQNTEEAVADFDDRFNRATAKAKVIENIIKKLSSGRQQKETRDGTIAAKKQHMRKRVSRELGSEKNIEDFGADLII